MTVSSVLSGVTISYLKYICAHGKTPRGYREWVFDMGDEGVFCYAGIFTEAKRAAVKEARRRGVGAISVGR